MESADPDLKNSQVTVKGVFDPPKLVEYVYKRTGKHAAIVKQEPPPAEKKEEDKGKEDKKGEEGGEKENKGGDGGGGGGEGEGEKKEKKEGEDQKGEGKGGEEAAAAIEETKVVELKKNEYLYYIPQTQRYAMDMYPLHPYPYPPQIFSDENPNACSVM